MVLLALPNVIIDIVFSMIDNAEVPRLRGVCKAFERALRRRHLLNELRHKTQDVRYKYSSKDLELLEHIEYHTRRTGATPFLLLLKGAIISKGMKKQYVPM